VSTDNGFTYSDVPNATFTTLSFTATADLEGNLYRPVFTNLAGDASTGWAGLIVNLPPKILFSPTSRTVLQGWDAFFTAQQIYGYVGYMPATVQWEVSTDGGTTFNDIPGETKDQLKISGVVSSQNGNEYRAVYTNNVGSTVTDVATLILGSAPSVTVVPTDQTVPPGQNVTFTAGATGVPAPTVQWRVSTDHGFSFTDIPGATTNTLSIVASVDQNGNQFTAVFSNQFGRVETQPLTLKVTQAPVITTQPANKGVVAGGKAKFTAAATGFPVPTVQWQISTNKGKTWTNIKGATSSTLVVTTKKGQKVGARYRAVFTNQYGKVTSKVVSLIIGTRPVITLQPVNQTVAAGATVHLQAAASGSPKPTVQWQVSTDGGKTFTNIPKFTSLSESFVASTADNGKKYRAVFTNAIGRKSTHLITLTVT
jgi:hypothetical protein